MLLRRGIFLAAILAAAGRVAAPGDAEVVPAHFRLQALGSGAFAAIAREGDRAAVGNAGFVVGSEAVLVVDSFATEDAARELLAAIRRVTPLPVRWVVSTHYHLDHVGGNAVFRREGAVLVAHENVRRWTRTENLKWRKEITPQDRAMLDALPLPDVTHRDCATLWLGDRAAEVRFDPGHTGGDSIVRLAEGDIVFGGDLFWNATVPNMIDADTAAWTVTVEAFARDYPSATFVPGHGEPGHALQVRFFGDYLAAVRQSAARGIASGLTAKALSDAGLEPLRVRYGRWAWFDQFAAANLEQTEQEMRGTKKKAK